MFELDYIIESEPLGTGGGIFAAIEDAETDDVIVVNGDTLFNVNLRDMMKFHTAKKAATTIALKEMHNFDRYGIVQTDNNSIITAFEEKKQMEQGLINGGTYIINKDTFLKKNLPEKFSFEKEYLEKYAAEKKFYGFNSDSYFIDIGIPEDYTRAQQDFKTLFV
jgi:D-glycero-alpha-D-manno-heptose 1-phosphate guanylyltransferase